MQTWFNRLGAFMTMLRTTTIITIDHIDPEAIAKRLKVASRARQEALEDRPTTTAVRPDVHEAAIVTYCRTLLRGLTAWYRAALSRELRQQEQAAAHLAPERLEACYAAAQHEILTHAAQLHDPLSAARRRERRALREWKAFRDEHALAREADYPASRSLYYAVLAAMVLVEAVANAYFFARGSDYGLLGGLLEALLVAGVNVAMAFSVGVALRGLHHGGTRRLLALMVGGLYVGVLALYQLAVGHYRMALVGQTPEFAASHALAHLAHAPLAISDLQTWLLMLVGTLFAIGAVIAGYTSDDPFPGYGGMTRRFKAAEAVYHGLKEQYLLGIQAVVDTQLSAVDDRVGEAQAALTTYCSSVAETTQLGRRYALACAALDEACLATQQRYRAINAAIRTTPPPAYFGTAPRPPFAPDEFLDLELTAVVAAEQTATNLREWLLAIHPTATTVASRLRALYAQHLQDAPAYFAHIEAEVDGLTPPTAGGAQQGAYVVPMPQPQEVSNGHSPIPSV